MSNHPQRITAGESVLIFFVALVLTPIVLFLVILLAPIFLVHEMLVLFVLIFTLIYLLALAVLKVKKNDTVEE